MRKSPSLTLFITVAYTTLFSASFASASASASISLSPSLSSEEPTHELVKRGRLHPKVGFGKTIRGVNLGGWFVLEAWMMPSVFTPELLAANITDQWTLMNQSSTSFSHDLLTKHWQSWITETDFQQIAAAGLNTVRIPVPHWAFTSSTKEPYWFFAEQYYIKQALLWAKKYNLDVMMDLHTVPNSQNGFDNSGRSGPINFQSVSPKTNQRRAIAALTQIVKLYVNDAQFGGIVKSIEIVSEPACYQPQINVDFINTFHQNAYNAIRASVAKNALVLPTIIIHDCFLQPLSRWSGIYNMNSKVFKNASFAIDTHRYQAFSPIAQTLESTEDHIQFACGLSDELSNVQDTLFPVIVGEWSLGIQVGGKFNSTDPNDNSTYYDVDKANQFYRRFFEAQVNTYEKGGGWIFWAWKTETRTDWSYKDAMTQGWIPKDPTSRVFQVDEDGCPTDTMITNVQFGSDVTNPDYFVNATSKRATDVSKRKHKKYNKSSKGNKASKKVGKKMKISNVSNADAENGIELKSHGESHCSRFDPETLGYDLGSLGAPDPINTTLSVNDTLATINTTVSTSSKREASHHHISNSRHSSVGAFQEKLL